MIMIDKGKHVKCFMRNGMVLEGIVQEWLPGQTVLKSLDSQNLIIVHRPNDDILLTKVVLEEPAEISEEAKVVEETEHKQHVREKLHEIMQPTGDAELDQANIKQLRQLVVEQDMKIIREKRKEHFGSPHAPGKMSKYSTPQSVYLPRKPQ
jgi:sRNA-binding regulator protein Hfq